MSSAPARFATRRSRWTSSSAWPPSTRPHENGKIERLHLTLVDTLLRGLPCYTGGRRTAAGRLQHAGAPLILSEFVARFATRVHDYNQREHSSLGGRTPSEVFAADPTPLRVLSVNDARALLAARKTVRVRRYGVRLRNCWFTAPELCELVGKDVQLAFAPHDHRSVEVYWRGAWACTAQPQETLTTAEQRGIIHAREAYARELRKRQRAAARRAQTRLAPLTNTDRDPVELLAAPPGEREPAAAFEDGELRAGALIDLLVSGTGPPRARRAG